MEFTTTGNCAVHGLVAFVPFGGGHECYRCVADLDEITKCRVCKEKDATIKELVDALEHICTKNPWLVMDQEFSVKIKQLLSEHRKP